jgi:hypothetical protein
MTWVSSGRKGDYVGRKGDYFGRKGDYVGRKRDNTGRKGFKVGLWGLSGHFTVKRSEKSSSLVLHGDVSSDEQRLDS